VPACDSQEYESVPEMWQATVPRWRGVGGWTGISRSFGRFIAWISISLFRQ